jgi:acyl-coenzyme A synthetase/AMP-(fatty) acid ligase
VVRDDGGDAGDGEIGTLWVKGDSAALCYWQAHEKSKQVLRGDWVVSGDLFSRDAAGYFYYAGRADDLLKVGGIFVSPLEVEARLLEHPAVHETAVVGFEDADGLVKPLAYVVPAAGRAASPELAAELIEHARAGLAHYKAPRRVEFVAALPRSDRGKVLRRELAK